MKKKIISILMIFAMLASFAACKKLPEGSYEAENGGSDSASQSMTPELEAFLDSMDTSDPAELEQKFEEMLETDEKVPELEFGGDLIDDSNSEKIDVELNEEGKPAHSELDKNYVDVIQSEKFTIDVVIKTKTNGEEMTLPIVMMRDGDKLLFKSKMPYEDKGTMAFNFLINNDKKCYIIMPALRAYMSIPSETVGDMLPSDFITEDTAKGNYVETREVVLEGKKYTCDVYESDGITTKNYFDETGLRRVESTDGENVTIMQINEISETSDSSQFALPKGYIDLATVMGDEFNMENMY